MNIYIQIFLIFAVLVVQRACKNISKYYEETRLELPEEILSLDPNSTIPESEFPEGQYHPMGKRSLGSELSRKETTKNEKINLEPEYFTHVTYSTNSNSESPSNESQLEEERLDFESEETGTVNTKHRSRGLKFYKTKDDVTESKINEIYKKEIEITRHMNDEKEKPVNLNKFWKKETETTRTLTLQNDNSEYFSSNTPSANIGSLVFKVGEEQHEVILSAKFIAALLDLGINPAQIKPGDPEIIERIYNIHKELLELIDKDVKTNIFPLMLFSTFTPVIKEYLTPHLLKPSVMTIVHEMFQIYSVRIFLNMLINLTLYPKSTTKEIQIMSSVNMLNDYFSSSEIKDNDKNRELRRQYEKILKDFQEIIDNDWKEYKAPVNLINYLVTSCSRQSFIKKTEMLMKQMEAQKEKIDLPSYKEQSSKDENSNSSLRMAKNFFHIGERQEL